MTERSAFIVVPAETRDNADKVFHALGVADLGYAFTVRLSATGEEPPTHYGANFNAIPLAGLSEYLEMLEDSGTLPARLSGYDWSGLDLTAGQARAAVASIIIYNASGPNGSQMNTAYSEGLRGTGLKKIPDAGT